MCWDPITEVSAQSEELNHHADLCAKFILTPRPRVDCTKVPDLGETATKRLLLPAHAAEVCLH